MRSLTRRALAGLARAVVLPGAALPATAVAQHVPAGAPAHEWVGAEVRVLAASQTRWRRGGLLASDTGRVVLRRDGWPRAGRVDTVALRQVRRLEARRPAPDRASRVVTGVLLGGLAGAVGGAYVASKRYPGSLDFLVGIPVGGVLGATLGATLGLTTGNRWVPIPLPIPNAGGG